SGPARCAAPSSSWANVLTASAFSLPARNRSGKPGAHLKGPDNALVAVVLLPERGIVSRPLTTVVPSKRKGAPGLENRPFGNQELYQSGGSTASRENEPAIPCFPGKMRGKRLPRGGSLPVPCRGAARGP